MGTNTGDKGDKDDNTSPSNGAENVTNQFSDEQKSHALQFLTTEHFTLQTARSATIADSASRASLFMSTVSGSLIALAFVGQMSQAGTVFTAFALVLFPTLFFIGIVTFQRVLQSAIEDLRYAVGINRIRHFYIDLVPQAEKYFVMSTHDDGQGVMSNMAAKGRGWWQLFLTTAGTVMVINSVLLGVFAGLVLRTFFELQLLWIVLAGLLVFGVSLAAHYLYQVKQFSIAAEFGSALYPTAPEKPQPDDDAAAAEH